VILITDRAFSDDAIAQRVEAVARALPPRWLCVQLRDKRRARVSLRVFASRLRQVTRVVGAALVINGDVLLARDVGADGVHIGRDAPEHTLRFARASLGFQAWISVAVHCDDAVRLAAAQGADAVLVSPIFASRPLSGDLASGERDPKAGRGLAALRGARTIVGRKCAVYALGGVRSDNAGACLAAGADGIAVIGALLASDDPARSARAIHDVFAQRC
jgi:thiamine-phosphate diphosphorylase